MHLFADLGCSGPPMSLATYQGVSEDMMDRTRPGKAFELRPGNLCHIAFWILSSQRSQLRWQQYHEDGFSGKANPVGRNS